jgi:hypothetical protein
VDDLMYVMVTIKAFKKNVINIIIWFMYDLSCRNLSLGLMTKVRACKVAG